MTKMTMMTMMTSDTDEQIIEWSIGEHSGTLESHIVADLCAAAVANQISIQHIADTIVIDPTTKKITFKFTSVDEASSMMEHASTAAAQDANDLTAFIVRLIE